jgi:hypothetical protein
MELLTHDPCFKSVGAACMHAYRVGLSETEAPSLIVQTGGASLKIEGPIRLFMYSIICRLHAGLLLRA